MKLITIEELDISDITIIDVCKSEDYGKGTVKGAVNIPIDEFNNRVSYKL